MAMKHDLENLDAGQLDFMWSMMQLRKGGATKNDVQALKGYLDAIRQAIVQKTGGEQTQSSSASVPFSDVGTYINMAIVGALWLRVTGALDELEKLLANDSASQLENFKGELSLYSAFVYPFGNKIIKDPALWTKAMLLRYGLVDDSQVSDNQGLDEAKTWLKRFDELINTFQE